MYKAELTEEMKLLKALVDALGFKIETVVLPRPDIEQVEIIDPVTGESIPMRRSVTIATDYKLTPKDKL